MARLRTVPWPAAPDGALGNAWLGRGLYDKVMDPLAFTDRRVLLVDYDLRKDRPYLGYETYDFEVPIGEHGDCYDRAIVRVEEMRQSRRIIEQGLRDIPAGPVLLHDPRFVLPPNGARFLPGQRFDIRVEAEPADQRAEREHHSVDRADVHRNLLDALRLQRLTRGRRGQRISCP